MRLILARHGNTFRPGETPVWVGAREDLPLTDTGEAQSRQIGLALHEAGVVPARIICGPLQRTSQGACLAAEACGFSAAIETDARLKEIDYGRWGGRSDADIAAEWGEKAIEDWRERSIVPKGAGWTPSPDIIAGNAHALCREIVETAAPADTVLVISSNGILRYFHALLAGPSARQEDAKVKTGHWGVARHDGSAFTLHVWNVTPRAADVEGVPA
ncbi:MAG: histidine phosphatase family protein [Glycocaulis sp.]